MEIRGISKVLRATAVLICGAAGSAAAADTDWQGVYAGLAVGGAYSAAGPNTSLNTQTGYFDAVDAAQIDPILQRNVGGWDLTGAALLGYDHRVGNLVVGIEADLTGMGFSEKRRQGSTAYVSQPSGSFETETSVSTDFIVSLRPKLGYATGNYLFYASAGPSLARIKTTLRYADNFSGGHTLDDTRTKTALGVSTGVGVGYSFGDGWVARGDYVLTYFPDAADGSAALSGSGAGDDFKRDGDFQSHNLRFALIKYF